MGMSGKKAAFTMFLITLAGVGVWAWIKVRKLLDEYDKTYFEYGNLSINYGAFLQNRKNLTGSFDFIIDNQGSLALKMKKLKLWVYVGGQKAAWITSLTPVVIQPNTKTTQRLYFDTPAKNIKPLLTVLASNITNIKQLDIEYKGKIYLETRWGVFPLPFTDKYKVGELMS